MNRLTSNFVTASLLNYFNIKAEEEKPPPPSPPPPPPEPREIPLSPPEPLIKGVPDKDEIPPPPPQPDNGD